ncbi:hypothetical protein AVEN_39765-1 [Araneus ventricosus]|uniref:Carboxylesterase type B domain-containing protein n=1 Tax=Araneus ventricosus TaxID=182803 RepID=A0A4Y2V5Q0_ARAVE|nr:hypothetical protein AVEN_39765-1 [Araneus ventricosus]
MLGNAQLKRHLLAPKSNQPLPTEIGVKAATHLSSGSYSIWRSEHIICPCRVLTCELSKIRPCGTMVIFIKLCCLVSIGFALCSTFFNWEAEPKCFLPREAHTIVEINKLRDVRGTVVNFTDPTNERLIEMNQFLGIPYALRPEGDLRFQPPGNITLWASKVHKHKMEKGCVQHLEASVPWAVDYDDQENLSEDCLYLNIWTPLNASLRNQKAVLFWVHGGFFLIGFHQTEDL